MISFHGSVGQNPNLCESGECNETKKKNIVTPILLVSISGVLILLIAVAILWICKRKKSKGNAEVITESSYFLLTFYHKVNFKLFIFKIFLKNLQIRWQ